MRILMVSPHPTYTPRGTPIAVLNRCRALCALGHHVDLVTYGIGQDVPVEGLRYLRAPVPGIRAVKVGPSPAKLPLDAAVFARTLWLLARRRDRYDVLHTHEEAGLLGMVGRRRRRLPHVYDMGNDLSVVMTNYGLGRRHPATRMAAAAEAAMVTNATVVIAHFPAIASRVAQIRSQSGGSVVIPNIPLEPPADEGLTASLRRRWSPDGLPLVLYTGTLEAYQGVEMLIDAMARLRADGVAARLVLIGGRADQRAQLRARADTAGLDQLVLFEAPRAQREIPSALAAADVLVSPRATGSNTPLKLFSYLASGRPIVATRIESHTQVLDERYATLAEPSARGLSDAIAAVLNDSTTAADRAKAALALAEHSYGIPEFVRGAARAYESVGADPVDEGGIAAAVDRLTRQLVSEETS